MAGLYIFLSLLTAVIFILTRECRVSIIKRDLLVIKVDLTFFAIHFINREKSKQKKERGEERKASFNLTKKIYGHILSLISVSTVEVRRLSLPVFPEPDTPSGAPFLTGNRAINLALLAYVSSIAKRMDVSQDTNDNEETDCFFHLIIRTSLIRLLYTVNSIKKENRRHKKQKRKRIHYVGNQNG